MVKENFKSGFFFVAALPFFLCTFRFFSLFSYILCFLLFFKANWPFELPYYLLYFVKNTKNNLLTYFLDQNTTKVWRWWTSWTFGNFPAIVKFEIQAKVGKNLSNGRILHRIEWETSSWQQIIIKINTYIKTSKKTNNCKKLIPKLKLKFHFKDNTKTIYTSNYLKQK